jgi:hypothetical protein
MFCTVTALSIVAASFCRFATPFPQNSSLNFASFSKLSQTIPFAAGPGGTATLLHSYDLRFLPQFVPCFSPTFYPSAISPASVLGSLSPTLLIFSVLACL